MPLDILRDFEAASLVATVEWGPVVGADAPQRSGTAGERPQSAGPGQLRLGRQWQPSAHYHGPVRLAGWRVHDPCALQGGHPGGHGVAGNEVHAAFQGIATVNSLVRAGKVRLIGVTTPRRMPQFADVPTVSESGLPGFEFNSWFALMAPAGTLKAIVQTLHNEISKALADPEVREKLVAQGLTPRGTSPDELAKDMRAQLARYGALIKQAGITAE